MPKASLSFALVVALQASTAFAQPPAARVTQAPVAGELGYAEVNLGLQATSTAFAATIHPLDFVEPATVQTNYSVKAAVAFDVGGGIRIANNLLVGASLSRFKKAGEGAVDAQVPHPFFFGKPRTVSGNADDLTRVETAVHAKLSWMAPVAEGWLVSLSAGPSFFRVGQDIVDDVTITQTYPYDSATFAGVVATRHTASGLGFNVGADITRLVTPHMGVGAAVVFSRAKLNLSTSTDTTMSVDAGGARISGGLRFRF